MVVRAGATGDLFSVSRHRGDNARSSSVERATLPARLGIRVGALSPRFTDYESAAKPPWPFDSMYTHLPVYVYKSRIQSSTRHAACKPSLTYLTYICTIRNATKLLCSCRCSTTLYLNRMYLIVLYGLSCTYLYFISN